MLPMLSILSLLLVVVPQETTSTPERLLTVYQVEIPGVIVDYHPSGLITMRIESGGPDRTFPVEGIRRISFDDGPMADSPGYRAAHRGSLSGGI